MFKAILKKLAYALVRVTPKKRFCYFKALPSYEDSAVAIYEALRPGQFDLLVWAIYNKNDAPPFELRERTIFVKKGSLRAFYYGVISGHVFTTHGHFIDEIPPNQICINVWHGMPYKGIRLLNQQGGRLDTYLLCTSGIYQGVMQRAFGMPRDRILINGLPRNDLLHPEDPAVVWDKAGIDRSRYDSVFFWLPTFRRSILYESVEDGIEHGNVFNIENFPVEDFSAFLKENRCLCIIKPHPMAPRNDIESTDNLMLVDEDWLWERRLTLYPLVGQMDFLVSDISSIMIDFMLLDRPMIVSFEDAKEYRESRSLIFDPIEDWLPGKIAPDYEALLDAIRECANGRDPERDKRHALKEKFHLYNDFNATKRLLDTVFGSGIGSGRLPCD